MSKDNKTEIDRYLNSEVDLNKAITTFYEATPIEHLEEEEFVYKSLVLGLSKKDIVKQLNKKYPEYKKKIMVEDIEWFLKRNPDVALEVINKSNALLQRQADVYLNHELAMAQVYSKASNALAKLEKHPDFDVKHDGYMLKEFLKLITDVVQVDAKIRGKGVEKNQVNYITMKAKEIVNNTVANPTDFQKQVMESLDKVREEVVDADYSVSEDIKEDGLRENNS